MKNKSVHKPLYKHFVRLRENIQSSSKFIFFKKQKWKKLIKFVFKKNRIYDQVIHLKPKFGFNFKNKFRFYLYSKQKLKFFYGRLSDKTLNQIYEKAKKKFKTQSNDYLKNRIFYFLNILEKRLDVILYRYFFLKSVRNAQQLILHGKVLLNGKKVTVHSYLIQKGDLIEIHPTFHTYLLKNMILPKISKIIPEYLEINFNTFQCLILSDINPNTFFYMFPFWLNLNKTLNKFNYY